MHPANERWRYIVTSSLIGMVHSQNHPWKSCEIIFALILILLMHLGGTFAHVTSTLLLGHVQNCDLILKWERNVFVEDLDCELTSPLGNDAFTALDIFGSVWHKGRSESTSNGRRASGLDPNVRGSRSPRLRNFLSQKIDCFWRTSICHSKISAVACAQLAFQMLTLQINTLCIYIITTSIQKHEVKSSLVAQMIEYLAWGKGSSALWN